MNGVPGYRMMQIYLMRKGIKYSKTTVHLYMKELGLKSIVRRKKPSFLKGNKHAIFPNILRINFTVSVPNKVWCTDFTYLQLKNGQMRYNCSILDLYDRSIVSTLNSNHIDTSLATQTLKQALAKQNFPQNVILHSDQGRQFAAKEFTDFCKVSNVQQSMSHAGCPYDNAPMERFYNTLKHEFFYLFQFKDTSRLNCQLYHWIYEKYNLFRPHSFNGGLAPYSARKSA